jgi:hypothetical protein
MMMAWMIVLTVLNGPLKNWPVPTKSISQLLSHSITILTIYVLQHGLYSGALTFVHHVVCDGKVDEAEEGVD